MPNINSGINQVYQNIKDAMGYQPTETETNNINNLKKIFERENRIPPTYSYTPNLIGIFSDGTTIDFSEFITIIQLEINFDRYVFPLFSLQLFIPYKYIPQIQFDDEIKFKLSLLYNTTMTDSPMLYDTLFEIELSKIKQISSPVNIEESIDTEDRQTLNRALMELKLIPTECLKANKKLFSGVYGNCTIAQIIGLMTANVDNKVFIQQPDNIKIYDQMIFIPYNVFYSLQLLENYYGIYDRGLKMFYGFDLFRIQSRNFYDVQGTNKVKIGFSSNSQEPDSYSYIGNGFTKLGDDNLITITPDRIKIYDTRQYDKEIFGTNITTFSRDKNAFYEQSREYDLDNNISIDKTKVYLNNYNNTNKEKEFLSQSLYTKKIELTLNDIIFDIPSLFKLFKLDFDSEYYSSMNSDFVLSGYYWRLSSNNLGTGAMYYKNDSIVELREV